MQLRLFDPDDEPTIPPISICRPYASFDDQSLQALVVLDLDEGHSDHSLKAEFDARFSKAFLDFFENMSPDPDGTVIKLSGDLKRKLEESAEHLNT